MFAVKNVERKSHGQLDYSCVQKIFWSWNKVKKNLFQGQIQTVFTGEFLQIKWSVNLRWELDSACDVGEEIEGL